MTGTTTALGLLERLAIASMYWIDMVTQVRETGKCVLPVLSLLSGGTIHPKLVFTWDTGLSNCKITLPPQVLANSNVKLNRDKKKCVP